MYGDRIGRPLFEVHENARRLPRCFPERDVECRTQVRLERIGVRVFLPGGLDALHHRRLLALLEQERGLVPRLFQKMDVPLEPLRKRLEGEIERRPRVSGPGAEPGKTHITQRLQRLILSAQEEAQRLRDEYVSVEHLVLAFLAEGTKTAAGRTLSEFQVTPDRFLGALEDVRGLFSELESGDPIRLADRTGYSLPRALTQFRELLVWTSQ